MSLLSAVSAASLQDALAQDPFASVIFIVLIAVSVAIAVLCVVSLIARIRVLYLYWFANRHPSSGGYTGETAARELLDRLGFTDVQVKKAGILRAIVFGNHYNRYSKTVYLRRSTFVRNNLTSVGLAVQKVGLVIMDKQDSKAFKTRSFMQMLAVFGPLVFIPLVVIGLIIDFVTGFSGIPSLALLIIALVFYAASFILTLLNVPVEKKANTLALEALRGNEDFLNSDEIKEVEKVLKGYIIVYVTDLIINILKLIQLILKILLRSRSNK